MGNGGSRGRGLARASDGRALRRALHAVEQQIAHLPREHAYVFDGQGHQLFNQSGDTDMQIVQFTPEQTRQLSGTYMTHNHPDPSSLSPADVETLFTRDMREIRAVTPEYVYSMRPPANKDAATIWQSRTETDPRTDTRLPSYQERYDAILQATYEETMARYRRGQMPGVTFTTRAQVYQHIAHEVNQRFAAATATSYRRTRRTPS